MLYRETGQFKTSYAADQAIFPIFQDRVFLFALILFAYLAVPLMASEYMLQAVLIPMMIFSIAALGLNILTGYAGQLSLGTGAFMAMGAYSAYKLTTGFPELNIIVVFVLSGVATALVGIVFGLPSLRIKGFYLAVATLAAQFFLVWMFNRVPWWYNYHSSGTITAPPREVAGIMLTGPTATAETRYLLVLTLCIVGGLIAKNLVRSRIGRHWMAIRDMDIAAEIIGIRLLPNKLLAFRHQLVLLRRRGSVAAVFLSRQRGDRSIRYFRFFRCPVHDHHRRAGQYSGGLSGSRLYLAAADFSYQRAPAGRAVDAGRLPEASGGHDFRLADHRVPDLRAGRAGPAVADRQGEAQAMAVPLLRARLTLDSDA